jgi:hypothetical protein
MITQRIPPILLDTLLQDDKYLWDGPPVGATDAEYECACRLALLLRK